MVVEALVPSRKIEEIGLVAFSSCFLVVISLFYYSVQDFFDGMQKYPFLLCRRPKKDRSTQKKELAFWCLVDGDGVQPKIFYNALIFSVCDVMRCDSSI